MNKQNLFAYYSARQFCVICIVEMSRSECTAKGSPQLGFGQAG